MNLRLPLRVASRSFAGRSRLTGCLFRSHPAQVLLSNAPLKTATLEQLVDFINTQAGKIHTLQRHRRYCCLDRRLQEGQDHRIQGNQGLHPGAAAEHAAHDRTHADRPQPCLRHGERRQQFQTLDSAREQVRGRQQQHCPSLAEAAGKPAPAAHLRRLASSPHRSRARHRRPRAEQSHHRGPENQEADPGTRLQRRRHYSHRPLLVSIAQDHLQPRST